MSSDALLVPRWTLSTEDFPGAFAARCVGGFRLCLVLGVVAPRRCTSRVPGVCALPVRELVVLAAEGANVCVRTVERFAALRGARVRSADLRLDSSTVRAVDGRKEGVTM